MAGEEEDTRETQQRRVVFDPTHRLVRELIGHVAGQPGIHDPDGSAQICADMGLAFAVLCAALQITEEEARGIISNSWSVAEPTAAHLTSAGGVH